MKRRTLVLILSLLPVLTGCVGGKNELHVIIKLQCKDGVSCEWGDSTSPDTTEGCRGLGGYSDLHDGMRITVRDGDGRVLDTGTMNDFTGICSFEARVNVEDADYYEIEAGNRSPYVVSQSELEESDWSIRLTIGDFT